MNGRAILMTTIGIMYGSMLYSIYPFLTNSLGLNTKENLQDASHSLILSPLSPWRSPEEALFGMKAAISFDDTGFTTKAEKFFNNICYLLILSQDPNFNVDSCLDKQIFHVSDVFGAPGHAPVHSGVVLTNPYRQLNIHIDLVPHSFNPLNPKFNVINFKVTKGLVQGQFKGYTYGSLKEIIETVKLSMNALGNKFSVLENNCIRFKDILVKQLKEVFQKFEDYENLENFQKICTKEVQFGLRVFLKKNRDIAVFENQILKMYGDIEDTLILNCINRKFSKQECMFSIRDWFAGILCFIMVLYGMKIIIMKDYGRYILMISIATGFIGIMFGIMLFSNWPFLRNSLGFNWKENLKDATHSLVLSTSTSRSTSASEGAFSGNNIGISFDDTEYTTRAAQFFNNICYLLNRDPNFNFDFCLKNQIFHVSDVFGAPGHLPVHSGVVLTNPLLQLNIHIDLAPDSFNPPDQKFNMIYFKVTKGLVQGQFKGYTYGSLTDIIEIVKLSMNQMGNNYSVLEKNCIQFKDILVKQLMEAIFKSESGASNEEMRRMTEAMDELMAIARNLDMVVVYLPNIIN